MNIDTAEWPYTRVETIALAAITLPRESGMSLPVSTSVMPWPSAANTPVCGS